MTWTEITRCQHDRRALRYASDCTDAAWALIEPLMPGPSKVGATAQDLHAIGMGRDPVHCDDGMPMGAFAKDFPPFTTVQYYFYGLAATAGYWI